MVSKILALIPLLVLICISRTELTAQKLATTDELPTYTLDIKKEAILAGGGLFTTLLGQWMVSRQSPPSLAEIALLDADRLWAIDRPAINNFSTSAEISSDVFLYAAVAVPFTLYAFDASKGEELAIATMLAETALISQGITSILKASTNRYRPYNYNPAVSDAVKLGKTSKESFLSGHASFSAALTFFSATVLTDLHPHWTYKKHLTWGTAIALPAAISYMRYASGKHFPTDLLTGYALGAAVGMIVPRLHRSEGFELHVGVNSLYLRKTF